jgi:hypothetical protein
MATSFRYRYVDFGTVFTGDPRPRAADSAAESPSTLFVNEIVTDVGGTCWGSNEPLAILDHHFSGNAQFPSASAAVLHKAKLIRDRFFQSECNLLWLVTHTQPDFDAFCSMYLVRWIIESQDAEIDGENYGLHPDGWLDFHDRPGTKIDWFNPDLSQIPMAHRWPILLASYASVSDARRKVYCPRSRALDSILYAALKRGRDYLNPTSGATEFFDDVKATVLQEYLNPLFDSVLESSSRFAPELAMLDRESKSYECDIRRARRSIVYLPQSEAPSPDFFKSPKQVALQQMQGEHAEINAEQLLLSDTFRTPTSGIYLRDPECQLFKEWARLDLENSALGAGFEFTAIASSDGRAAGTINKTDYVFSIDPERANGRQLYTVWSRLQTKEVEALRSQQQIEGEPIAFHIARSDHRAGPMEALLADPWVGGQSSSGTLIKTPHRGTTIGSPGMRHDLRDDPVVEAVRTELEDSIYSAESLAAGPQVTVIDSPGSRDMPDITARRFDLGSPLQIPPPAESYFRFAEIGLRADVPIIMESVTAGGLAQQIGDTLWQVLYPETPGATPPDFSERHLIVTSESVGVWSERGIALAQKHFSGSNPATENQTTTLRDDFSEAASLIRDIDRLIANAKRFIIADPESTEVVKSSTVNDDRVSLDAIAAQGEELTDRAIEIQSTLALPNRELLRRFADTIGLDQLVATLRDRNRAATDHLRRRQSEEQARQMKAHADREANMLSKLEWLKVFIVGFLAIEMVAAITRYVDLGNVFDEALRLLAGPLVLVVMAVVVKPWKRKVITEDARKGTPWVLIALVVACIAAWLAALLPSLKN